MPVTLGKTHFNSLVFDTWGITEFDNVASVGANVALTAVQARLPIPCNCRILRVSANASAFVGAVTMDVVLGTGARTGTVPAKDVVATAGQGLFATAPAVITVADTPSVVVPDVPDGIWPLGGLLTLRVTTIVTTGSLTNLKVTLLISPVDLTPQVSAGTISATAP